MPRNPLISIVDDDDALRSSLENLIESVGLRAQGFPSAEAFLRSNRVHETRCLILDVRMPGMSGLELQRQMVLANSHMPAIFITAHEVTIGEPKPWKPARWRFCTSLSTRENYSMNRCGSQ